VELATETELDVVDTGGWLTAGLWSGIWRTGGCTEGGDRTKMRGVLGTLRRFGVARVSSRRGVSGSLVMVAGAEVSV